jgi:hypothetical protein
MYKIDSILINKRVHTACIDKVQFNMKMVEEQLKEHWETETRILARVKDLESEATLDFTFIHSRHSRKRAKQRGFYGEKIGIALAYGEPVYKQGLLYYILGEKNIPEEWEKRKREIRNTIVVVNGRSNVVVTCYRSKNPFKHIKKKSKILHSKYNAA